MLGTADRFSVGFKYLNFGTEGASKAELTGDIPAGFKISIRIDSYDGKTVSVAEVTEDSKTVVFELGEKITGRHAVYFGFNTENAEDRAVFDCFRFE